MKAEEDFIFFYNSKQKKRIPVLYSLQNTNIENIIYKNKNSNIIDYCQTFSNVIKKKNISKTIEKKEKNKNSVKLPLLINKNIISSFEKRKKYKIILPEKKQNIANLTKLNNKSIDDTEDKDNKEKNKNKYMNYFLRKAERRKKKINKLLYEINKTEDRFNKEKPDVDSNLISKEKILVDNKWKNSFYLDEYQQFFTKNLKGHISSMNYRKMIKTFRDISLMCFSPGNEHHIPKKLEYFD